MREARAGTESRGEITRDAKVSEMQGGRGRSDEGLHAADTAMVGRAAEGARRRKMRRDRDREKRQATVDDTRQSRITEGTHRDVEQIVRKKPFGTPTSGGTDGGTDHLVPKPPLL